MALLYATKLADPSGGNGHPNHRLLLILLLALVSDFWCDIFFVFRRITSICLDFPAVKWKITFVPMTMAVLSDGFRSPILSLRHLVFCSSFWASETPDFFRRRYFSGILDDSILYCWVTFNLAAAPSLRPADFHVHVLLQDLNMCRHFDHWTVTSRFPGQCPTFITLRNYPGDCLSRYIRQCKIFFCI